MIQPQLLKLALRNIVRQKTHTLMALSAIISGVVALILAGGWVNDIYVQLAEGLIHSQSGHAQVYKKGFYAMGSRTPANYMIPDPDTVKERIARSTAVEDVMARLNFSALLNNGHSDLPIIGEGVETVKEAKLGTSVSITAGRRLGGNDLFGMVVGAGVAQSLQLTPGDRVTLLTNTLDGAMNTVDFELVGVFRSFSNEYDARAIKIPLGAAQELLGTKGANALVVSLKKTSDTNPFAAWLKENVTAQGLEVKTWVELNDFYEKTVQLYKSQFGVLQIIILVMVLLSVTNTVNMSVFERVGEFGTMMSLGNRSNHVFQLIMTESVMLGSIGSALGVLVGAALGFLISKIGIPMPPPPNADVGYMAHIQLLPGALLTSFTIGFLATTVAALLPAFRVSRTPVVEALRSYV